MTPQTPSGRALVAGTSGDPVFDDITCNLTPDVLAIETESRDAVLDALEAAVKGMYREDESAFGPDEFWVDSEPYVRAYAVLEAIQQQRRQP